MGVAVILGCSVANQDVVGTGRQAISGNSAAFDTPSFKNDTAISFHGSTSLAGPFLGPPGTNATCNLPAPLKCSTEFCTGTLITPRVVVTAAHCINGTTSSAANGQPAGPPNLAQTIAVVGVDYSTPAPPIGSYRVAGAVTAHQGVVSPAYPFDDIAIVVLQGYELANAYAFHPTLTLPASSSTTCPTGAFGCLGHYDQLLGDVGFSPYAALAPQTQRHLFQSTGLNIGANVNNGWADYYYPIGASWVVDAGDSGGPWWVERQAPLDQGAQPGQTYRDVLGVNSQVNYSVNSMAFASIVHEKNKNWLLSKVIYATSPLAGNPHSSYWYQQHGKTDQMWIGDVDYIGACRNGGNSALCRAGVNGGVDCDCDHWYDHGSVIHDNCINTYNPGQDDGLEFSATPGTGDGCRVCRFGDTDGDGVCDPCTPGDATCENAFKIQPWPVDNCVNVLNSNQANGNLLAEQANHTDKIWGDVCDPVPHAKPDPQDQILNVNCTWVQRPDQPYPHQECTGDRYQSEIVGMTVAPHPATATSNQPVPVTIAETRERFCQANQSQSFDCAAFGVIKDAEMTFYADENAERGDLPAHPWHRVSTKAPVPSLAVRNRLLANWTYGTSTPASDWSFAADLAFWTAIPNQFKIPLSPSCTTASCLDGSWWFHTETPIGNTSSTANGVTVGVHGDNLANAYSEIQPGGMGIAYCPMPSQLLVPTQPKKMPIPPGGYPILVWPETSVPVWLGNAHHKTADFVVATNLGLGVLQTNGSATAASNTGNCGPVAADGGVASTMLDPNLGWLSASEPVPVGTGPDAVAISQDGTSLMATAMLRGVPWTYDKLDCTKTGTCGVMKNRAAFAASYSRGLGGVLLAGGTTDGQVNHDVWFLPLGGAPVDVTPSTNASVVCPTCNPAVPLGDIDAIAYSVRDSAMWLVDEITDQGVLSWRVSRAPMRGAVEVLAVFPKNTYDVSYLSFDQDGATLLTLASQTQFNALTARLEVQSEGMVVTGLARLTDGLVQLAPVTDSRGYGFVVSTDKKSGFVKRIPTLPAYVPKRLSEEL